MEDANNPSTDPLDENFEGEIEPAELHEPIEIPEPSHPAPDFILKGPILPAVVRLAWPIWIAVALQDAYTLVDLFWVGKLGRDPVAAIALCGVLMGMAFTVAIGLATGVVAMVSRFVGAGKREAAWAVAWQALYMGVAAGALSTVLGLLLAGPALRLLGAEGNVLGLGTVYLQVLACGSAALFLTFSLNSALRGVGDTITPMVAMGMGTCVNLVLDPLLIFGWLGFPRLGVMGSALATVIAQGLSLTFILLALFSGRVPIRLRLSRAQLDLRLCWRILRIGIFGSLQMWVRNASSLFVVRIVNFFGPTPVAAFGICMRILMVILLPGFGVGNSASIVVGQNLGAKQPGRAVHAGWVAAGLYAGFCLVSGAVLAVFAPTIIGIFNQDQGVILAGAELLRLLSASFPFIAFSVVLGRAMAGAGDTIAPMRITAVVLLGVQVPSAYLLSRVWGHTGIWVALAASSALNGLIMMIWYHRGRWVKKKI
ncbi:MAG: MATE family efflux transporter [Planctomycetota bacterium]